MSKKTKSLNEQCENIKIILLGGIGVGKTSIIDRFDKDRFNASYYSTYGSNFITKKIKVNDKNFSLDVWDTAGQEQYHSLAKIFVKNTQIVILVYDITSKKSFEELNYWNDFLKNELGEKVTLGLAGNKIDLFSEEEVSKKEGKQCAEKWNALFALLSAKEDKPGIDAYFTELIKKYLEDKKNSNESVNGKKSQSIKLQNNNNDIKHKNNGCCGGGRNKKEKKIKIVFLGENGIGKTNIINALKVKEINKKSEQNKKLSKKIITYSLEDKQLVHVNLIDTNGNEFTDPEMDSLVKECQIFYLIHDFKNKNCLKDLENTINKICANKKEKKNIYILGNKTDYHEGENDSITYKEAQEFSHKNGIDYEILSIEEADKLKNLIKKTIDKYLTL